MNFETVRAEHLAKAKKLAKESNEAPELNILRGYMVGSMAQEIAELRKQLAERKGHHCGFACPLCDQVVEV